MDIRASAGVTRLTARGRALVAAAGAIAIASWWLGQTDTMRVAVLFAVMPLASWQWVRRSHSYLDVRRHPDAPRVGAGDTLSVALHLENRSGMRAGVLLSDELPSSLGHAPRLALERLRSHAKEVVRYEITPQQRGIHRVGPLHVRAIDPFGLAQSDWTTGAVDRVLATPRLLPVDLPPTVNGSSGDENRRQAMGSWGRSDVLPREHRSGDDIRRVHWSATARTGTLMVRREERSWRDSAIVLIDNRAAAHAGSTEGFEYAVRVAASVSVGLVRGHWTVRLVDATGQTLVDTARGFGSPVAELMDACAQVELRSVPELMPPPATDRPGLVIAVTGVLDDAGADALRDWAVGSQRVGYAVVDAFASDVTLDRTTRGARRSGWDLAVVLARGPLDDDSLPQLLVPVGNR